MNKLWLIALLGACAGAASAADNCEALRTDIEARIAKAGVTRFALITVDVNSTIGGQVVGSCALGTRKIVYQREAGQPGANLPGPASGDQILTECRDGTVSVGGDCRR